MKRIVQFFVFLLILSCGEDKANTTKAQQIVDQAIKAAGGERYLNSRISFTFRDRAYIYYREAGQRVLKRITAKDSTLIEDIKIGNSFERKIDGRLQELADTSRVKFSEAVNSVHYFAYLPYGLNDAAVNKKYLGRVSLKGSDYHKIEITFDQEGGGTDFEDVFVYWFNTETFYPDYLAYEYHTSGGGIRFREAFNGRKVGGIRFADYRNFKYEGFRPVSALDRLYEKGELKLHSQIELENLEVTPDNYN